MRAPSGPPLLLVRPASAGRETLSEYRARGGYEALTAALALGDRDAVLAEIAASELRGRGGAGFPVGRKWQLAAREPAARKFVVANGGEHEPGSLKDKHLLTSTPHAVLEGAALAAFATGAQTIYVYVIEDMHQAIAALEAAIAEFSASRLHEFDVRIHRAPPTYVAGEETAAIAAIEGQPAKPRQKPPYPGNSGIESLPTTVNNVETLAHVPAIIRHGADWFRTIGTPGSTGTMLFTLDEHVNRPGLHELAFGATVRDLIEGAGCGVVGGRRIKAILPALSSSFISGDRLDLVLDHDSLAAAGSGLGCGGVHLVVEGESMLEKALEIARFFKREQCGQCSPCRMETNTLVALLEKASTGVAGAYLEQAEKIAAFTRKKGFCSLIEMAAAPVLSAMRLYPDEFAIAS